MDHATAEPRICPFLRAFDDDGALGDPIDRPDPANRCIALGGAAPQSLRQQAAACLTTAHVNCPRFVRGGLVMIEQSPATESTGLPITPGIVAAMLVLAASFALSVGFVVANGGLELSTVVTERPSGAAPSAAAPSASAGSVAAASETPSAEPTAEVAPSAQPSIAAAPGASAPPSAGVDSSPGSDRYALLTACTDEPDCWIYVVRGGDNLVSIARYFGVPLEVVTEHNPWTETTQLVAGQELRLPPPTR